VTARPTTIADTPGALTAGWLTDALASTGLLDDAVVTEVETAPLGTGQMCDSVRVTLSYSGPTGAPTSLIAKLPAADPTSRATALALGSYEKEVRFYQQLAPGLAVRTPQAHYADIDTATASFVLLLEDLTPAEQGDQLAGCSVEQAELAVDELGRLHSSRWGDPSLAALPWLHADAEASQALMMMLVPNLWTGFQERYADALANRVHTAGEQLVAKLAGYLTDRGGPRTVVHGDFRLDNLLFDPNGRSVAVVDWQTCTDGPGPADLAYFIGAGLLDDDRHDAEPALVTRYADALADAGVAGYSHDQLWDDYRRGTWAGLVMAICASMMVERTERGDQMFLAMAHRHATHALDHAAVEVL
jgi:hypothetical protein